HAAVDPARGISQLARFARVPQPGAGAVCRAHGRPDFAGRCDRFPAPGPAPGLCLAGSWPGTGRHASGAGPGAGHRARNRHATAAPVRARGLGRAVARTHSNPGQRSSARPCPASWVTQVTDSARLGGCNSSIVNHQGLPLMKTNVGTVDRILRIAIGIVLIGLAATGTVGWWGWLGIVPFATGLIGWCPPYAILGLSTCRMKS